MVGYHRKSSLISRVYPQQAIVKRISSGGSIPLAKAKERKSRTRMGCPQKWQIGRCGSVLIKPSVAVYEVMSQVSSGHFLTSSCAARTIHVAGVLPQDLDRIWRGNPFKYLAGPDVPKALRGHRRANRGRATTKIGQKPSAM
jgi:hypothetical protein